MMNGFATLLGRDLQLAWRSGVEAGVALAFFVLALALFPLALGPGPALLGRIAPGIIVVAALLAMLLSLERVFAADYEDGSLDRLAASALPLEIVAAAKALAHWLTTGVPLMLTAPLMALMLQLPQPGYWTLTAALALATLCLSLLGAVGAALTLGARRGGALLAVLVLPLAIPVLIFAAAAIDSASVGESPRAALLLLSGFTVLALPLAPIATAGALRQAVE